jgi:uncharacterized damage-inducible protein DinB
MIPNLMTTADSTYRQLLRGHGAHADPVGALESVSAEVAGRTIPGYPHSIWQIVSHLNYWMDYELRRIAGKRPPYPEHAIESWPASVAPLSDADWQHQRAEFARYVGEFRRLSESAPEVLNAPVDCMHSGEEGRSPSAQAILWQILVHNSYHVGQIALLLRCFHLWPPPAGGATW